ncbi:MAG: hypothetical protein ABI378_08015 [Chitinophagaceae bacterium]
MKAVMLDTDILSEFLRGNPSVTANVERYLLEFRYLNLSIITYYEILNGLCTKTPGSNLEDLKTLSP